MERGGKMNNLTTGTQVIYTGDMANHAGRGEIVAVTSNRWSPCQYDIRLDDGREMRAIQPSNFSGPGRRFQLQSEYDEQRRRFVEQLTARRA
jgi:hypothetical protein